MVRIVVSAEQAKKISASREAIEVVDEDGNCVGYFTQPFPVSEILEAKRRSASEKGGRTADGGSEASGRIGRAMMQRTVVWTTSAEEQLAEIGLKSNNRNEVSGASRTIESALRTNAELVAQPLSEGLWVVEELSLRAICEILHDDSMVHLLTVNLISSQQHPQIQHDWASPFSHSSRTLLGCHGGSTFLYCTIRPQTCRIVPKRC